MSNLDKKLKEISHKPGCYFFKNGTGDILYIGKAKDLKKRVSNYFRQTVSDPKTVELVKKIVDVETMITDTELEALLLEARLIKQHQPPYNMELKGGNRYAYIRVTDELFPRLETIRSVEKNDQVFGPFADAAARRNLIRLANSLFRLRSGKAKPIKIGSGYQFSCSVPPWKRVATPDEYKKDIERARLLLKGDTKELLALLRTEMKAYAAERRYELAKLRRDQIHSPEYLENEQKVDLRKKYDQQVIGGVMIGETFHVTVLAIRKGVVSGKKEFKVPIVAAEIDASDLLRDFVTQYYSDNEAPQEIIVNQLLPRQRVIEEYLRKVSGHSVRILVPHRGAKKKLLELVERNILSTITQGDRALVELQRALSLPRLPQVIECFDISNLGNQAMVGSMVQFRNGKPDKANYRHFHIKWQDEQSDVDAIKEIVSRRYYRLTNESASLPDLVVIDGGKPQLGMAYIALHQLGLKLPLISLAKQEEEIFIPGQSNSVRLSRRSDALKLLQRIRDEAHRFAITFHRKTRAGKLLKK